MTFTWHPLLLATEHTEFDTGAERVAFHLACALGVPLAGVLPYLGNPEFEVTSPHLAEKAETEVGARADVVEDAAAAAGVILALEVRGGPELHVEIVDEAQRIGARCIVIRRRGKTGFLKRMQVGEVVVRVIARSPCSALIVPREAQPWRRGVLLAMDAAASSAALGAAALAAAALHRVPLHVIEVAASGDTARGDARAGVTNDPQNNPVVVELLAKAAQQGVAAHARAGAQGFDHKPAEGIVDAARTAGCDLIVLGRDGGDVAHQGWIGSVTHKVVGLAECAVLVHVPAA